MKQSISRNEKLGKRLEGFAHFAGIYLGTGIIVEYILKWAVAIVLLVLLFKYGC